MAAWIRLTTTSLCLVLSAPGALQAAQQRNIRFERISLEQGLSQSIVNCIVQDVRGFIWIGTQDGLNRYDGYELTTYKHDPLEPGSLSHNTVWALHVDSGGSLWIGTDGGGLSRFDPKSDTFINYRHDPRNPASISSNRVRVIQGGVDGRLWIGTDGGGLNLFDPASGRAVVYRHDPANPFSLSSNRIRGVLQESNGTVWIATDGGGLNRFHPTTRRFTHYRHDPSDPRSINEDRVRAVFKDRHGFVWVGTYGSGLNRIHPRTGHIDSFRNDPARPGTLSDNRVRAIYEDHRGTIWLATDRGLAEWVPETGSFLTYVHDPADPASLSGDGTMSIYEDRGGVLWVGTQGRGLNKWYRGTEAFGLLRKTPNASATLSSNTITSIRTSPDGHVWIGTYEGLNRLDPRTGAITVFRHDPQKPGSLSDNRVMSLLVDRAGTLWVGTFDAGLHRFDARTGTFTNFRHDPADRTSISGNGITSIVEDGKGRLWVGVFRGGLNGFDRKSGTFARYEHDAKNPASLIDNDVLAIYEDSAGTLWVGTDGGGLSRFDPETGRFQAFRHDAGSASSLSSDVVFSILEGRDGALWIGTQGGGLNRWQLEDRRALTPRFRRYSERDGLPNDFVYGIVEDERGRLWLSTNRGLSRMDPTKQTFRNLYASAGLQSNEFNFGAYHESESGEVFFGGNDGLTFFHPDEVRTNEHVPPVVLTAFYRLDQKVPIDQELDRQGELLLQHEDNLVTFEFAALDFAAPEQNRYAYMLAGFNDSWIDLRNNRRATFTNLDAGSYTLRVRGCNQDNVCNETSFAIPMRVLPPPWKSWWAYTLYGAVVVLLAGWYVRIQTRKRQREIEYSRQLELEVEERTRELAVRNVELQALNERLENASITDALTGLNNRRALMANIQQDIAAVDRYHASLTSVTARTSTQNSDFAIMMIDFDGLKWINDTLGHLAGDRALIQLKEILEIACRRSDTVYRWGGDEFLVVARNVDRDSAEALAQRIGRMVEEFPFDLGAGQPVRLSCSIGFALYPFFPRLPSVVSWEQVLTIADRALYVAKASGRNAWVGLFTTSTTPMENITQMINASPGELVDDGRIELRTSIRDRSRLVCSRESGKTKQQDERRGAIAHVGGELAR